MTVKVLDNGPDGDSGDYVPVNPPFGGVTDIDHICGRCGVNLTGCALCAGMKRHIVRLDYGRKTRI